MIRTPPRSTRTYTLLPNRTLCRARPQCHAVARAGPRSAARLRTPPLALGGRSGAYQRTQPAEREPLPPYAGQARLCARGRRALYADAGPPAARLRFPLLVAAREREPGRRQCATRPLAGTRLGRAARSRGHEADRASCRDRVWQYG